MTHPTRRPFRTATALVAAAASAALLAGCGTARSLAGVEPAPAEQAVDGSPLTEERATEIAERVLGVAAQARAATGDEAEELRTEALTGPAYVMASAASQQPAGTAADAVSRPAEPTVVALSRGSGWPRAMVVTTTDGQVQKVHLLTATDARTPFRVRTTATVRSGQVEFGPVEDGAEVVTKGIDGQGSPAAVMLQYAGALAYPKPATPRGVSISDPFAGQVKSQVAAQAKALGTNATVTEKHEVLPQHTQALELADGTLLVFGLMARVDTVTKTDKAQSLTYAGRPVTKSAVLTTYESVVITVPTSGNATLLAADEQVFTTKIT